MLPLALVALHAHRAAAAPDEPRRLQLEVYIDDVPAQRIGSFTQLPGKQIAARRSELIEVGIKVPGSGGGDELVIIDNLPGVYYRYDAPTQKIFFTLGDNRRVPQSYDARGNSNEIAPSRADYGSVLNYALFGASTKSPDSSSFAFSGANASLDARLFGPAGTLNQSGIVGTTTSRHVDALRLDSTWSYSNPQNLLTYRAGDVISGGLTWTRPIRIGGVQAQRNFALRPDLVTLPLPSVSGSAAVPSTLDVYVDSVKTYSQEVATGPYQISNVPVLSGAGTARVVVRDAAGRQTETSLPFYTSPHLLKQGLLDFSVEAGLPRILYGTASSTYVESPLGSASLRGGLYDWLTVETHAEAAADFFNAGVGFVTGLGPAGVLSLAGIGSRFGGDSGFQGYFAFDTQFKAISLHASSQQTFGIYNDLASVTTRYLPQSSFGDLSLARALASSRPPKSLDTLSIGFPLTLESRVNVGLLRQVLNDGTRANIINVSYSRPIFSTASLYLTAFSDLSDRKTSGVFLSVSMLLGVPESTGGPVFASTSVSGTRSGTNVTVDAGKSIQPEIGSYGWSLRDSEGSTPYRSAAGSYRSSVAQFDGYLQQSAGNIGASAQVQGSIAAMSGGVFLSNRIDDAFAVVDAGAPGVDVEYENRPVGKTNARGQLLIPDLRSYQRNQITIDPRGLPVDADVPTTQSVIAPPDRSGVKVSFGIKTEVKAAVVILADKNGKFVAPGSRGRLENSAEVFVVGYDGRAYVRGLADTNTVTITLASGECRASFPFASKKNSQVVIGPVVCQ